MKYNEVCRGIFIERPNRFIARVRIGSRIETVHVKNTGRCRELLLPDIPVVLAKAENPKRKTQYDLIAVEKAGLGLVNIDSQAPNKVVAEWLAGKDYDMIKSEYTYGDSRIDFYMEKDEQKYLLEVKGCTLERGGMSYFPDAPTERGVKHLRTLIKAQQQGYRCGVAFVIQMPKVKEVRPNQEMLVFMMVMGMMTYSGGSACGKPVIHLGPVGMSQDIESFKELFETYGRRMGEQLLKIR